MALPTNLRPAEFGGARFHVEDRTASGGHRIVDHQFPKRDLNFPEEMGRKSRQWSVDAYVIGADYMQQRDALVAACERHGAQQYSDHWGRSGRVICETWDVVETRAEGRFAKIRLTFINAGPGGAAPVAIPATAALVSAAGKGLASAAAKSFKGGYRK